MDATTIAVGYLPCCRCYRIHEGVCAQQQKRECECLQRAHVAKACLQLQPSVSQCRHSIYNTAGIVQIVDGVATVGGVHAKWHDSDPPVPLSQALHRTESDNEGETDGERGDHFQANNELRSPQHSPTLTMSLAQSARQRCDERCVSRGASMTQRVRAGQTKG